MARPTVKGELPQLGERSVDHSSRAARAFRRGAGARGRRVAGCGSWGAAEIARRGNPGRPRSRPLAPPAQARPRGRRCTQQSRSPGGIGNDRNTGGLPCGAHRQRGVAERAGPLAFLRMHRQVIVVTVCSSPGPQRIHAGIVMVLMQRRPHLVGDEHQHEHQTQHPHARCPLAAGRGAGMVWVERFMADGVQC